MFDANYYQNCKQEIQLEFQKLVNETYEDVERAIVKKFNKSQEMQKKLQELEKQEAESKKKDEVKPAKK